MPLSTRTTAPPAAKNDVPLTLLFGIIYKKMGASRRPLSLPEYSAPDVINIARLVLQRT
jgi:hypothetical protein